MCDYINHENEIEDLEEEIKDLKEEIRVLKEIQAEQKGDLDRAGKKMDKISYIINNN